MSTINKNGTYMAVNELDVVKRWVGDSEFWLKAFVEQAVNDTRIVCVVVMGSAIRPRGHRRSDFDLLVLYEGDRPRIKAPIEVDIRKYPVERADRLISEGHEVLCWAVKFGHLIYDRSGTWGFLKEKWADHVPMPSAEDAFRRAKRSLQLAKDMVAAGDEVAASDLFLAAFTQSVRERLIRAGIFPASRPELPDQLRRASPEDPLADLLEDAMFADLSVAELADRYEGITNDRSKKTAWRLGRV